MLTELEDLGVKPIEAVGKEFDPNFHNAVMQVEDDELEPGTVAAGASRRATCTGTPWYVTAWSLLCRNKSLQAAFHRFEQNIRHCLR